MIILAVVVHVVIGVVDGIFHPLKWIIFSGGMGQSCPALVLLSGAYRAIRINSCYSSE